MATRTELPASSSTKKHCLIAVLVSCTCVVLMPTRVSGFYAQPEAVGFILSPRDQVSCEGCGAVELSCGIPRQRTVANLPDPVINWLINKTQVSVGVEHYTNSTHIWSVLTLPRPTLGDSGLYQCTATDRSDQRYCGPDHLPCVTMVTLSNEARVQIIGEAEGAKSISLSSCSATLLKCTSISLCDNCVGYQVHWTRNGIRVSNSQEARVLPDGSLVLSSHGDTELTGLYQCLVTVPSDGAQPVSVTAASYNVSLEQDSTTAMVEVVSPKTAYFESESVNLVCTHKFNSAVCPNISWSYNDTPLNNNNKTLTLHALGSSMQQSGNYCCTVTPASGEPEEACLMVNIYPTITPSSTEASTIFSPSTGTEISTALSDTYPLIWYRNGVQLERETRASLSLQPGEEVYGVYQCFLSLTDHTPVLYTTVRAMPPDRVNPPSQPQIMEIVRASDDIFVVPYRVTWEAPLYTANQSLHFRLQQEAVRSNQWDTRLTSLDVLVGIGEDLSFFVQVLDSNGSIVSDRSEPLSSIASEGCGQYDVLYPPSISLSCDRGWVDVSLQDNAANTGRSRSRLYYIRGSCTFQNGSVVPIEAKLAETSLQLQFFPFGTHCTLTAAATGEECGCICTDPDLIEFTAPSECHISGTVSVGFAQEMYEVTEEEGVVRVCATAQTLEDLQNSVQVHVQTVSGSAQEGDDFEQVSTDIMLTLNNRTCVNITIKDDSVVENSEEFTLTLNTTDPLIHIANSEVVVRITDNDQVAISPSGSSIVSESDSPVQLCVEIDGTTEKNISVSIDTIPGTALDGVDFLGVHKNLTLTARQCVQVEILNDSILEDSEWFMFTVSSTDPSVLVAKGELEVTIADDDYVTASLSGSAEVAENNISVIVCIEIGGTVERRFSISMDTLSGTAIEGTDFIGVHKEFSQANTSRLCEIVEIEDDVILEDTESFSVNLNSTDHGVQILEDKLELSILDDDYINVSLIPIKVKEGDTYVQLCAEVDGVLGKTVMVSIDTVSNTTSYDGLHESLTFLPESVIECVNISIIDDDVVDNTTTFTVILSSEDSTVRVTQGRVNVNVLDNDRHQAEPTTNTLVTAIGGFLAGLASFVAVLVIVIGVTVTYTKCKEKNMTIAQRKHKEAGIKTNDRLYPDPEDLLAGVEQMHLRKVPEEDTRSEFETYNSHGGSIMDIPGLDESPVPTQTRKVLVANQLRSLEEWTLDYIRDGASDTSGISSADDYIHLTDDNTVTTYRGRSSPPMTNFVPDSPT